MGVLTILQEAARRGLAMRAEGGRLVVSGPRECMTPELAASIREHRAEIIAALSAPVPSGACASCGEETRAMLTMASGGWCWLCPVCYERGTAEVLRTRARNGEPVAAEATA